MWSRLRWLQVLHRRVTLHVSLRRRLRRKCGRHRGSPICFLHVSLLYLRMGWGLRRERRRICSLVTLLDGSLLHLRLRRSLRVVERWIRRVGVAWLLRRTLRLLLLLEMRRHQVRTRPANVSLVL